MLKRGPRDLMLDLFSRNAIRDLLTGLGLAHPSNHAALLGRSFQPKGRSGHGHRQIGTMLVPAQFVDEELGESELPQAGLRISGVEIHPQPLLSNRQSPKPERADDLRFAGLFFVLDQRKPILLKQCQECSTNFSSLIPAFIWRFKVSVADWRNGKR